MFSQNGFRFFKGKGFTMPLLVALASILVYLPALHNGFVEWDDHEYVYQNPHIRSLDMKFLRWAFFSFHASNWHPLTWISHALDYAVWGLNPMGHHLTSVVLHGLNAFLVVIVIVNLLRAASRHKEAGGFLSERGILMAAGITGLIFGLHPIHAESVVWVSERKDMLCAFFFLLSVMSYMSYARNKTYPNYLLSFGFFILALLSKPMAVTLPVVLLIMDWYPFRRFQKAEPLKPVLIEKLPFFAIGLISVVITLMAQHSAGAIKSLAIYPLSVRILVGIKALVFYWAKMLWPADLLPYYPYPQNVSLLSFEYTTAALSALVITAACAFLSRRQPVWAAIWIYYVVTLLPVLGIIQVGKQAMADRYTYLPGIGLFLLTGIAASMVIERLITSGRWNIVMKTVSLSFAAILLGLMSYTTTRQTHIWKNDITLWSYEIERNPTVAIAYSCRGVALAKLGYHEEALKDYERAINLDPNSAVLYYNRGNAYARLGYFEEALTDYSKAINLSPAPNSDYYYNRGVVHKQLGHAKEAARDITQAEGFKDN